MSVSFLSIRFKVVSCSSLLFGEGDAASWALTVETPITFDWNCFGSEAPATADLVFGLHFISENTR